MRALAAADGRQILQIRLELGVLQLEMSGRPDGHRPAPVDALRGPGPDGTFESLLHVHQARRKHWSSVHGDDRAFVLTAEECAALREEAVQYYHRYVGLLVLEDYPGVVRDTTRNLEVFDLCRDCAAEESDRAVLEQFRPYVLMMRTRAQAAEAMKEGQGKVAVGIIERGLLEIRAAFQDMGASDRYEESNEVQLLRGMREMIVPRLPVSQRSELQERLRAAIAAENYELAAILRDELRMLEE